VTGLLHRSELDRRLDSLGWEPGDEVFVQVKGVRDNGNIDLAWSIRQADREFRGVLVQDGDTEHLPEEGGEESDAEADAEPDELDVADDETADASDDESADVDEAAEPDEGDGDVSAEADEVAKADEADDEGGADETDEGDESDADEGENESGADESAEDDDTTSASASRSVPSPTPSAMRRGLTAKLSAFDRPAARPSSRFSTRRVSSTWPRSSSQVSARTRTSRSATRCGSTVRSRATGATCRSSPRRSSS